MSPSVFSRWMARPLTASAVTSTACTSTWNCWRRNLQPTAAPVSSCCLRWRRLANRIEVRLQLHAVERVHRQIREDPDAMLDHLERLAERQPLLRSGALHGGGIGHAPMRGHGLTGPVGTYFPGGVVADREHEIERGPDRGGKLIPALAAQFPCWQPHLLEELERQRMYGSFRVAAGTQAAEPASTPMIDEDLGENAARGIARAQKKHVIGSL